jgi:hypothetical protein
VYHRDLQWHKANREKARQREINQEKIRLVMGEEEDVAA